MPVGLIAICYSNIRSVPARVTFILGKGIIFESCCKKKLGYMPSKDDRCCWGIYCRTLRGGCASFRWFGIEYSRGNETYTLGPKVSFTKRYRGGTSACGSHVARRFPSLKASEFTSIVGIDGSGFGSSVACVGAILFKLTISCRD